MSQDNLKYIFWKSFKMNKLKINPMLIHVKKKKKKKKNKLWVQIM